MGKIGQGKSALFNAILNELEKFDYKHKNRGISVTESLIHSTHRMQTIYEGEQFQICGEVAYVS